MVPAGKRATACSCLNPATDNPDSQGASEGRGTCDWPPRVVLEGSAEGTAQVELRGLIMHNHTQSSGNGGVITTNGDTLLVIVNASFIRNKVASVAQRETCILIVDNINGW